MADVLMSIKPKYAEAILAGEKTIELRRRIGKIRRGDRVYIYVTYPVCRVKGYFTIRDTIVASVRWFWACYSGVMGVDLAELEAYGRDRPMIYGLAVDKPTRIEPIELGFHPPQSYRFLTVDDPAHMEILAAQAEAGDGA